MSEPKNHSNESETFTDISGTSKPVKGTIEKSKLAKNKDNNALPMIVVGALIIVALGVLVIPVLTPETTQSDQEANTTEVETTASTNTQIAQLNSTPAETPWADAQLLKARREAQEILAELLGIQNRLESALVETWAKEEFDQVRSLASEGDRLYTDRQFDNSIEYYQDALDQALILDLKIEDIASQFQQKGTQLLSENQVTEAIQTLEIAQQIDPDLKTGSNMLTRAQNREQVLRLIELSHLSASSPETLEIAKQHITEAQTLDAEYEPLAQILSSIEEQITDRDYRQQMGLGYSALQQGQYDQAKAAFQQAKKIKPNDSVSTEALQQAEAGKLNTARQRALNSATELEANEYWQEALEQYNSLLQEDGSLTAARLGKLRTEARVKLDMDIQAILDEPLGLQNQSKWQAAQQTLSDAQGIINPSEAFTGQVDQLQYIIKKARTPVTVKLQSDNQTEVEVYRVGQLGTFAEQAMNLNPGNYVIVGKRNGYQDVRIELSLDGSSPEVIVPVICSVTI